MRKAYSLQHFDCLFRHKTLKNFKTLISSSSPLLPAESNGSYIRDQSFCLVPDQKEKFKTKLESLSLHHTQMDPKYTFIIHEIESSEIKFIGLSIWIIMDIIY